MMILKNRRVVQGGGSNDQTTMGLIDTDQAPTVIQVLLAIGV
jgi:hypothetical protein